VLEQWVSELELTEQQKITILNKMSQQGKGLILMPKKHKHHHVNLSELINFDARCIEGIFGSINNGIIITDENAKILYVNPAFSRITGYAFDEVIGGNPGMLHSGIHNQAFYESMWQQILSKGYWQGEIWNRNKSGTVYPEMLTISRIKDSVHEKYYYIAVFEDIGFILMDQTEQYNLAFYDPLTLLPNRNLLRDRFEQIKTHLERMNYKKESLETSKQLAVLFLDLNKFKPVNDTYGHILGDMLLKHVAKVLKKAVRKIDTVCRFGGDEFVILLPDIRNKENVIELCKRMNKGLNIPVTLKGIKITPYISIGIAFFPEEANNYEEAINSADKAMYHAKKNKLDYYFYHDLIQKS